MDLPPRSRLGPYDVIAPLGAGGMGEVYRARDTRLGRDVALKRPTADRLADPAARSRFERETAIVSRLVHPRICTLLDAGTEGDQPWFAMELLRGETLATHLDRAGGRGLPLSDALDIAIGVCDALAFAHRHGVVHRDVKPANIMLTPDGVKLLDFGVARIRTSETGADARSATATLSITGTPAYMAPEQIDGRADHRSDLFSLGAVLYEMLAGRRAFPGESSSEIIGAVVRCAPQPLAETRPDLPAALTRLVHRCLRRDADERWHTAADLGEALRWIQNPSALPTRADASGRRASRRGRLLWAITGAVAVAATAFLVMRGSTFRPPEAFYVDDIALPDGVRGVAGQVAWSRDGRRVALVTQRTLGDVVDFRIWTLAVGSGEGWRLVDGAGPEHVTYPSWSPDGTSLTYFRGRRLVRSSMGASAAPVPLAEAPDGRGTAWLDDNTILYAPEAQGDIWQVPAVGGTPKVAIRRQAGDLGVKYPVGLPDNDVLFWAQRSNAPESEIRVASSTDRDSVRTVVQSATAGSVADGYLFFVRDNMIVSQRIDPRTWSLRDSLEQMAVETGRGSNLGAPYVTAIGSVVAVQSVAREESELTWVDRTGTGLGTVGPQAAYRTMALSPDGQQLLIESAAPGVDLAHIWLLDMQSGTPRQIVTDVGAMHPTWHPDEGRLAFRASRGPGGSGAIYEYELNGRALRTLVETPTLASARPAAWIDERRLLWWAADATGRYNGIFVREGDEGDHPYRTIRLGADIRAVALRPGGTGIAYMSNESGVFEIYADAFPTPSRAPRRVSQGGGRLPRWSRDGRELFFVADDALHAVAMTGSNGGPTGPPRRLFAFEGSDYEVHPDGRLLIQRRRRPETQYLRVFRNWASRPARGAMTADRGGQN